MKDTVVYLADALGIILTVLGLMETRVTSLWVFEFHFEQRMTKLDGARSFLPYDETQACDIAFSKSIKLDFNGRGEALKAHTASAYNVVKCRGIYLTSHGRLLFCPWEVQS